MKTIEVKTDSDDKMEIGVVKTHIIDHEGRRPGPDQLFVCITDIEGVRNTALFSLDQAIALAGIVAEGARYLLEGEKESIARDNTIN